MTCKSMMLSTALLKLIFNGTPIPNLADNAAVNPQTGIYMALHTAEPAVTGSQTSSEVNYTGYARVLVPRSTAGWTVTGDRVSPVAQIVFGERTDTGAAISATHVSFGLVSAGAGDWLYVGRFIDSGGNPLPIPIQNGTVPIVRQSMYIEEY